MGLTVTEVFGRVQVNGTDFAGSWPNATTGNDCVSLDVFSLAQIFDGPTLAAQVSTNANASPPTLTPGSPPTQSVYLVYYNQSYRWQVKCPGGSIGIRI